jgi:hypothetical protein
MEALKRSRGSEQGGGGMLTRPISRTFFIWPGPPTDRPISTVSVVIGSICKISNKITFLFVMNSLARSKAAVRQVPWAMSDGKDLRGCHKNNYSSSRLGADGERSALFPRNGPAAVFFVFCWNRWHRVNKKSGLLFRLSVVQCSWANGCGGNQWMTV